MTDFVKYLLDQEEIHLAALAKRMWPTNKSAATYLSKKLNNLHGRSFTDKDEILARSALKDLGEKIINDSQSY